MYFSELFSSLTVPFVVYSYCSYLWLSHVWLGRLILSTLFYIILICSESIFLLPFGFRAYPESLSFIPMGYMYIGSYVLLSLIFCGVKLRSISSDKMSVHWKDLVAMGENTITLWCSWVFSGRLTHVCVICPGSPMTSVLSSVGGCLCLECGLEAHQGW